MMYVYWMNYKVTAISSRQFVELRLSLRYDTSNMHSGASPGEHHRKHSLRLHRVCGRLQNATQLHATISQIGFGIA